MPTSPRWQDGCRTHRQHLCHILHLLSHTSLSPLLSLTHFHSIPVLPWLLPSLPFSSYSPSLPSCSFSLSPSLSSSLLPKELSNDLNEMPALFLFNRPPCWSPRRTQLRTAIRKPEPGVAAVAVVLQRSYLPSQSEGRTFQKVRSITGASKQGPWVNKALSNGIVAAPQPGDSSLRRGGIVLYKQSKLVAATQTQWGPASSNSFILERSSPCHGWRGSFQAVVARPLTAIQRAIGAQPITLTKQG